MKTRNSIINAIVSLLSTTLTSILSLISTNLILQNYGSDFNGVVATISQLITILLLLEGGITYASNYALYKPYVEKDYGTINAILTKTYKQFIKIGLLLFIIGLFLSLVYPLVIKSNLNYVTVMLIMLMVVVSSSFNIFFTTKLNVLFQASQKEYLLTIINFCVTIITSIVTILMVVFKINMLFVRLNVMLSTFAIGIITYLMFKKVFPKASYTSKKDIKIVGAKDIIVQRVTGVIYGTAPMMFMSSIIGTIYTSVYAVYNSIFTIVKTVMYSIVSAPSNGFGLMITTESPEKVYKKFIIYELIIIILLSILLSSILSIILPFIKIYTRNVKDINYVNQIFAVMFAINIFFELMHTPSGTIISVSGKFKVARNIQIIACLFLIPSMIILAIFFGIYGIMSSLMLTSLLLAMMEIYYAHVKIFNMGIMDVIKIIVINFLLISIIYLAWDSIDLIFQDYWQFLIWGFIIIVINAITIFIINYFFFKKEMREIIDILIVYFKKINHKIFKKI